MFRDYIQNPIDPIPGEYTRKLKRLTNEPDYSLTCLGIAMLKPRMKDYEGIDGSYAYFENEASCVEDFKTRSLITANSPTLFYYMYSSESDADVRTMLEGSDYLEKQNIGTLLKDKAKTKCIAVYHKDQNVAAIFVNSRDIRYYHLLISFIPLLFPNMFVEMPLRKPEDYDIIKSLSKPDQNAFVEKIQDAVKPYLTEFRSVMLNEFLHNMHEVKIAAAMQQVNEWRQRVHDREEEYANTIQALKQAIVTYEGMKAVEVFGDAEKELVDYLTTKEEIHNLKIIDNKICFTVATLLINYNENAWTTFSERGGIYDGDYARDGERLHMLPVFQEKKNRKKLLDNLFSASPDFSVKICGNYEMNIEACRLKARRDYDYVAADPMYDSYLPNPHLRIFACLGGYENRVMNALRDQNYIGAIEMCCASAGSVDLDETEQTFRPFIGWILSSEKKILRRNDGVDMTPEEALIWLIDKEKE